MAARRSARRRRRGAARSDDDEFVRDRIVACFFFGWVGRERGRQGRRGGRGGRRAGGDEQEPAPCPHSLCPSTHLQTNNSNERVLLEPRNKQTSQNGPHAQARLQPHGAFPALFGSARGEREKKGGGRAWGGRSKRELLLKPNGKTPRVARPRGACDRSYWNWIVQPRHWRVHASAASERGDQGRAHSPSVAQRLLPPIFLFPLTRRPKPAFPPSPNACNPNRPAARRPRPAWPSSPAPRW